MDQLTVAARCRLAGWFSAAFTQLFLASETGSDEAEEEQEDDIDEDYETVEEEEDSEVDEDDENDEDIEDNEDNEGPDQGQQHPVADQPTDIDLD
jgi:DNA-directed RNA polymerase delta subunit